MKIKTTIDKTTIDNTRKFDLSFALTRGKFKFFLVRPKFTVSLLMRKMYARKVRVMRGNLKLQYLDEKGFVCHVKVMEEVSSSGLRGKKCDA